MFAVQVADTMRHRDYWRNWVDRLNVCGKPSEFAAIGWSQTRSVPGLTLSGLKKSAHGLTRNHWSKKQLPDRDVNLVVELVVVVRHHDLVRMQPRDRCETAVDDRIAELRNCAEISIRDSATRELTSEVATNDVSRLLDHFIGVTSGVQAGAKNDDQVLNARRYLRHAALAVGQFKLMLAHCTADFRRRGLQTVCGEFSMSPETVGHLGQ